MAKNYISSLLKVDKIAIGGLRHCLNLVTPNLFASMKTRVTFVYTWEIAPFFFTLGNSFGIYYADVEILSGWITKGHGVKKKKRYYFHVDCR